MLENALCLFFPRLYSLAQHLNFSIARAYVIPSQFLLSWDFEFRSNMNEFEEPIHSLQTGILLSSLGILLLYKLFKLESSCFLSAFCVYTGPL